MIVRPENCKGYDGRNRVPGAVCTRGSIIGMDDTKGKVDRIDHLSYNL